MSDFKDVAHKTVAELFDMLKEKVAEIERKQAEIDLLKRLIEIKDRVRDEQQAKIDELQKRIDGALFEMQQLSLMLSKDIDGYEDPAQICQSEGVDMGVRILEKSLRGEND